MATIQSKGFRPFFMLASLTVTFATVSSSYGVVVIRDGFGDGDRNNNGTAFELNNATPGLQGDVVGDYVPFFNGGTMMQNDSPLIYPAGTTVIGPTVADDTNDVGIRWTSTGGITNSGAGDPAASPRIINDAAGFLPETVGNSGFFNSIAGQTQNIPALDSGLALSFEGKGRGRSISGFFERDQDYSTKEGTISLGPKVNDEVKVSFDFRVWMSAPNYNTGVVNHVPNLGEIRFGLYQDADNQLGQTNLFAGPTGDSSRVWGAEDGAFRGDFFGPDASGDPGWFARLPIYDLDATANPLFGPFPDGRAARIVQETNGTPTAIHLQGSSFAGGGDTSTAALPDQMNSQFVTMENTKRYRIELSLKRFDETGMSTDPTVDGDNIEATITVTDIDNPNDTFSFGGSNALDPLDPEAGFFSDAWDYFSITTGGASSSDQLDFILDNFVVEVFGSNAPVDTEPDGDVDGADFLNLQRDDPSAISRWQSEFGSGGGLLEAASVVPEPTSILSLCLGGLLALGSVRRTRN